jgi:hypothetical protein
LKVVHELRRKIPKQSDMDKEMYDGILYEVAGTYRADANYVQYQPSELSALIINDYIVKYEQALQAKGTLANALATKGLGLFPFASKSADGKPIPSGWEGLDTNDESVRFCIVPVPSS